MSHSELSVGFYLGYYCIGGDMLKKRKRKKQKAEIKPIPPFKAFRERATIPNFPSQAEVAGCCRLQVLRSCQGTEHTCPHRLGQLEESEVALHQKTEE